MYEVVSKARIVRRVLGSARDSLLRGLAFGHSKGAPHPSEHALDRSKVTAADKRCSPPGRLPKSHG